MAHDFSYSAICAQVNSAFEVRGFADYIGWHAEKMVRQGDVFRMYCPIHGETVFRTLVLNPRNNTYHCEHTACPGHHAADFLDLLCKVQNKSLPEVIQDAVDHFGAEYFRLNERQLKVLGKLVEEARMLAGEPPQM